MNTRRLLGDINRRRGTIVSIEAKNGQTVLNAEVPLAEMFVTRRRSVRCRRPRVVLDGTVELRAGANSVLTQMLDAAAKKPAART